MADIGRRIKRLRTERGLSLRQLGELAGVSSSYISQIERGDAKNPGIETLTRIARALGVDLGSLLGITSSVSTGPVFRRAPPIGTTLEPGPSLWIDKDTLLFLEQIVSEMAKVARVAVEGCEEVLSLLDAWKRHYEDKDGQAFQIL